VTLDSSKWNCARNENRVILDRGDSKSEARNSNVETISNDRILNVRNQESLGHFNFENSDLFRISIFGFWIFLIQATPS
jgi:hypothetical protein